MMEKKWSIIFLGISFILFSLAIPITQDAIDTKMELGRAFIANIDQSQTKINLAQHNLGLANTLAAFLYIYEPLEKNVSKNIKTEKLQKLITSYNESAAKELRYAIICLYYVLNNKMPGESLIEEWKKMSLEALNKKQVNMFKESNPKSLERDAKIKKMINIKGLFSGLAAFFYFVGMMLQIIVRKHPAPK